MTDHSRDYLERTIATVRNHRGADNCWPQWANIFADEIERLWAERDERPPKTYWTCAWCGHENGHDGVMCDECHHYGQPERCPTCDGAGAQSGAHTERIESCPTCEGTGRKKVEAQG